MRVLVYGNQGNLGYRLVRWLRQRDVEAVLYLDAKGQHQRSRPEWEDPELRNGYPDYIRTYRRRPGILGKLYPPRCVARAAKNVDAVISSGYYVIGALTLPKPVIFIPVGGDLTQIPFRAKKPQDIPVVCAYWKRIRNVARILTAQEDCVWAARLIGVGERVVPFPIPVDVGHIQRTLNASLLEEISQRYSGYSRVFFCPARKNLDPSRPAYKGQEKLLEGLDGALRRHPHANVRIVMGLHGHHARSFRSALEKTSLPSVCDFVGHLPLPDLHAYMQMSNVVVFDQFGSCASRSLGGIARESLSLGAPVICGTETACREFEESYGAGCPLIPAFSVDDIAATAARFLGNGACEDDHLPRASIQWARQHLDWRNRIDEVIRELRSVSR